MSAAAIEETGKNSIDGQISHCGKPMKIGSRRTSWTGKPGEGAQHAEINMSCQECEATAVLKVTEPD